MCESSRGALSHSKSHSISHAVSNSTHRAMHREKARCEHGHARLENKHKKTECAGGVDGLKGGERVVLHPACAAQVGV